MFHLLKFDVVFLKICFAVNSNDTHAAYYHSPLVHVNIKPSKLFPTIASSGSKYVKIFITPLTISIMKNNGTNIRPNMRLILKQ